MKDSVIRFLRETIIGKTLFADDIIYKLGEGRMEGVYSDQMMFSDLVETLWVCKAHPFCITNRKNVGTCSN